MKQLPLSLPEPVRDPAPLCQRERHGTREDSDDDSSSEEEIVEILAEKRPARAISMPESWRTMTSPTPQLGVWPAALTWEAALAYTSLSPLRLRHFQKRGVISVRRAGRNGARIILRSELDQLLETIFAPTSVAIEEDFNFG